MASEKEKALKKKLKTVRIIFGVFCALLFLVGTTICGVAISYYLKLKFAFEAIPDLEKGDVVKPSQALIPLYLCMGFGGLVAVTGIAGGMGAFHLDRCCLVFFIALTGIFMLSTVISVILLSSFYSSVQPFLDKLIASYSRNFYGWGNLGTEILDTMVDTLQHNSRCCGVINESTADSPSGAQSTVVWWMDSTVWGQKNAERIQFSDKKRLPWAPKSCCRSSDCDVQALYVDRLRWSNTIETTWARKIWTKSCKGLVGKLREFSAGTLVAVMFFIMLSLLISLGSIGLAIYIWRLKDRLKKEKMDKTEQPLMPDEKERRRRLQASQTIEDEEEASIDIPIKASKESTLAKSRQRQKKQSGSKSETETQTSSISEDIESKQPPQSMDKPRSIPNLTRDQPEQLKTIPPTDISQPSSIDQTQPPKEMAKTQSTFPTSPSADRLSTDPKLALELTQEV